MKWKEFKKKPIKVLAVKLDKKILRTHTNGRILYENLEDGRQIRCFKGHGGYFEIDTLEGVMRAKPGDWIIKGVKGEIYPCREDIFEETYECTKDDYTK